MSSRSCDRNDNRAGRVDGPRRLGRSRASLSEPDTQAHRRHVHGRGSAAVADRGRCLARDRRLGSISAEECPAARTDDGTARSGDSRRALADARAATRTGLLREGVRNRERRRYGLFAAATRLSRSLVERSAPTRTLTQEATATSLRAPEAPLAAAPRSVQPAYAGQGLVVRVFVKLLYRRTTPPGIG